jgi:FlaA1/EpsC-like NDP-sugar epimerase
MTFGYYLRQHTFIQKALQAFHEKTLRVVAAYGERQEPHPQILETIQMVKIRAMMKNNKSDPKICNDDFKDRLVVVTGGTSGIGYYTCRKYASHGARILSINRNKEKSEGLCESSDGTSVLNLHT